MSLLKRWDRRNQRIAEWQLHGRSEKPPEDGKFLVGIIVVGGLLAVLKRDLPRLIGLWYFVLLGGVVAILLVVEVIRQRKKRLAWEEAQRRAPDKS